MANIHPSHSPRRRHAKPSTAKRHWRLKWWHFGLVVLVMMAVGAIASRPRAGLVASARALTQVKTAGLHVHIARALVVTHSGRTEPLRIRPSGLWPKHTLLPGHRVIVRLTVTGLFGWSDTHVFSLKTPGQPKLRNTSLTVDLNHRPTVSFTKPVAQVLIGNSHIVNVAGASKAPIGSVENIPDQHGALAVAFRSRTWEPFSRPTTVSWTSVPWLTATATQDSTGHTNLSTAPIDVTFSSAVSRANTNNWSLSPFVRGRWKRVNRKTWQFDPTGQGWAPDSTVTLSIPNGSKSPVAQDGSTLAKSTALTVQLSQGTTVRLQEWLAELGYLPLSWTPPSTGSSLASWSSAYSPPTGQFSWRYSHVPVALRNQWNPTYWTAMTQAAVIAFQHQDNLTVNGIADPQVWSALRQAVKNHTAVFTKPYAYVYVSETLPERLWLWVGGKLVLTTLTNTGIPKTPTTLGSYAVDVRDRFQIMRGKNPNGIHYADQVHWINYFDKSQAVHGFLRAHYGFPQSLGCVEVPIPIAKRIYPHLYIGALVTVQGPGSSPLVPSNHST